MMLALRATKSGDSVQQLRRLLFIDACVLVAVVLAHELGICCSRNVAYWCGVVRYLCVDHSGWAGGSA
jgi:hypothetical protein